jgi:hypothetical protein
MDLSNRDLDYMIPKGSSHTSVPDSTYEVEKIKYNPTRKILVPFRTTKVCSFSLDLGSTA